MAEGIIEDGVINEEESQVLADPQKLEQALSEIEDLRWKLEGIVIPEVSSSISMYDTGWINTNDWSARHLGTTALPKNTDSNVTHNLDTDFSNLIIKLFVSSDGTEANAFEMIKFEGNAGSTNGLTFFAVDADNIKVQTGSSGIYYINDASTAARMDTDDWYYKVKVYKLT